MTSSRIIAAAIACAALLLVAAGCGGDADSNASGGGEAAFEALKPGESSVYCNAACQKALRIDDKARNAKCTVAVSWSSTSFPYGAASVERSKKTAKGFPNMTLLTADGRGSATTQTSQVDDFVARGVDVLIISPFDSKALAPAVKRATDAGVKVIASDRNVDAPVTTYIGADNVDAGKAAGDYIVKLLPDGGNVIELQGSLGASPTIARHQGFEDAIKANSDVKVIESQTANYDRAQGLKVTEDLLQAHGSGEVDAIFAHNDEMALGAIQAIREAGRADEIKVVGIDGQESALRLVEAGRYAGTVVYPLPVPEHILAAAKVCAGEKVPERIEQVAPLVTKENVAKYDGTTF
jgi:ribose transport system substrate-binding protein